MKLSKQTLETLKNFSVINNGVVLNPGRFQRTVDGESTIYCEVNFAEEIPCKVAISELPQLLGIIAQLGDPDIEFSEKFATVSDNDLTIKYWYSEADLIVQPREGRRLEVVKVDAEFDISNGTLAKLLKAASSMDLQNITILGRDGTLNLVISNHITFDPNQESTYAIKEISEYTGADFVVTIPIENLRLVPDDYHVKVEAKRLVEFSSKTRYYVVAIQKAKKE